MCGIAGIVGRQDREVLEEMVQALVHRGPDDQGVWRGPDIGLGMRRLSIIDLAGGGQPMTNEDETLRVVFNGEIYNYRDLRADLLQRGHQFRTHSDTEVLLHLYEEAGAACVEPLRGMFAFALWDAPRRSLLLARDRLGKKPLYYWHRDGLFLFASEIKALLRHPGVSRDVDWEAFHHYLAFGYTPAERSIFDGIAKLPPAHAATLRDGALRLQRYWSLPAGDPRPGARASIQEVTARVRHELREAVRLRLESDVPLGVFLSGGIDSSAVVASVREVTGQRIATFSIGFGRAAPSYDELTYARMVARRFETDHHEEILEPKAADLLPAIVHHFDEPFADSSAIPTFVVAQATARHVKVVLSGIGGDETFAGYPRYLGVRLSEVYRRFPSWLRTIPSAALLRLARESEASPNWGSWVRRFFTGADRPLPDRYIGWTRFFDETDLKSLATPSLRERWGSDVEEVHRAAFATHGYGDPMDGAFRIDLSTYLPNDLLTMADRMSMAHSLELRAPFCDHRVIEESLRIPPGMKVPGFRLKGLLKTAFADVLPPQILSRRKQGFMIPLAQWLRTDLREMMEDLLSPERIRQRGLFVPDVVEAMKQEHLRGIRTHSDRLWTLMIAELWMQQYLEAREVPQGGIVHRTPSLQVLMVSDVSPTAVEGGGERVLWELASGLARRGHRVRVVGRSRAGSQEETVERQGVRISHFPVDRRSLLQFVRTSILEARRAAIQELAGTRADVLQVFQPLSGYGVLGSAAGQRIPSLYTFLSPAPLEYRSRRGMTRHHRGGWAGNSATAMLWIIERACLRRATRIQVLSDFSADQLRRLYRIPAERIVKIPGGVDIERFQPAADRGAVREALGLPARSPLLLTVRNLETRMGLDTLIRAMARLRRHVPEVLLLIGGAGTLRGELESLAASLNLRDHVQFLGYVPEAHLPLYYQAADLFVLPTRELEGFGLVTVEALACGTPVLGTRVGATPEILLPLDPSLVFRDSTPEGMAEDLRRFLDATGGDHVAAESLRPACRRYAEAHFTWDISVSRLEAILRDLALTTAPRSRRASQTP